MELIGGPDLQLSFEVSLQAHPALAGGSKATGRGCSTMRLLFEAYGCYSRWRPLMWVSPSHSLLCPSLMMWPGGNNNSVSSCLIVVCWHSLFPDLRPPKKPGKASVRLECFVPCKCYFEFKTTGDHRVGITEFHRKRESGPERVFEDKSGKNFLDIKPQIQKSKAE